MISRDARAGLFGVRVRARDAAMPLSMNGVGGWDYRLGHVAPLRMPSRAAAITATRTSAPRRTCSPVSPVGDAA